MDSGLCVQSALVLRITQLIRHQWIWDPALRSILVKYIVHVLAMILCEPFKALAYSALYLHIIWYDWCPVFVYSGANRGFRSGEK